VAVVKEMTMEFKPVHVGPNTPYADEPSETVPVGWYVTGRNSADHPEDGPAVIIKVEQAAGADGADLSEAYATIVASAMNTGVASAEALHEARTWARHGYEIAQRSCTWFDHGVAPKWLTAPIPGVTAPPYPKAAPRG
jgi:hypothetical protein